MERMWLLVVAIVHVLADVILQFASTEAWLLSMLPDLWTPVSNPVQSYRSMDAFSGRKSTTTSRNIDLRKGWRWISTPGSMRTAIRL